MSDDESMSPLLPGELEVALSRAVLRSANSLSLLRSTLKRHVRNEHRRGKPLSAIDRELRSLVERIEEAAREAGESDVPDGDLVRKITAWNKSFYEADNRAD